MSFDDSTMKMNFMMKPLLLENTSHLRVLSNHSIKYLMKSFFKYKTQAYSKMAANMNNMHPINQISIAFNPAALGDVEL